MKPPPPEDPIRPHTYDGIQEYDKRLPNWWLYTLYITIVFWVGYWSYYEWFDVGLSSEETVTVAMNKIQASRLAAATIDDATLWQMSRNPAFVEAGRATYATNCAACHLASLRGKAESPVAIGPDLTDNVWISGGKPTEINDIITHGVLDKGMPSWGSVLGARKISELTALILSYHQEGDPILRDPASTTQP